MKGGVNSVAIAMALALVPASAAAVPSVELGNVAWTNTTIAPGLVLQQANSMHKPHVFDSLLR